MRTRAIVLPMSLSKLRNATWMIPSIFLTILIPTKIKIKKKVLIQEDFQNRKIFKNIEKTYLSAHTLLNNTMLMECVKIATMLKAELRKHLPVNMEIELCMLRVCARTATWAFTTKRKDPPRSQTLLSQALQLLKAFEQRSLWSLLPSELVDRCFLCSILLAYVDLI